MMKSSLLPSIIAVLSLAASKAASRSSKRPNFVIVLTDDLDWTLGGGNASTLSQTRRLLLKDRKNPGLLLPNWFVHTPVCCPSRAQILTGRMFHNLQTAQFGHAGCMHVDVQDDPSSSFYSDNYFAKHFQDLNYTVGYFGKHLNNDNPTDFIPSGIDCWLINGGGDYLNPSFTWASKGNAPISVAFDNCTTNEATDQPCYSTSVIGNVSLSWMERHLQSTTDDRPFMNFVSVKAPHIQDGPGFPMSTPAPWYQNQSIPETRAPRTLNYNQSCPDHHWLVRSQPPLSRLQGDMVDQLYLSRLRSLLSVDDLMVDLISILKKHKVLDNTYVVFTSDHGYRLGQFRMPACKLHVYENDIRVPMMIRGPNLKPRSSAAVVGTHVDLMPTLLGLATGDVTQGAVPSTMDGRNLAGSLLGSFSVPSSKSLILEYLSLGNVTRYQHLVDTFNHTFVALRMIDPSAAIPLLRNLKYVEYRDSRVDWHGRANALEIEVFDLDQDPMELINLANQLSPSLLESLHHKLERMFRCKGDECRNEQVAGLGDATIKQAATVVE